MSDTDTFPVTPEEAGQRLDQCLARRYQDRSRSFLQRLIEDGRVSRNSQDASKSAIIAANDLIEIEWPDEKPFELCREDIPFPIVYEDDDILVVDKPAGLVVHPGKGQPSGTLVNALLGYDFEGFSRLIDRSMRPGIVHRLDKDTSGALVVARTPSAKAKLGGAFRARTVKKMYLALVWGRPKVAKATIRTLIGHHPRRPVQMAVLGSRGKEAITTYTVLATGNDAALLGVEIETGRTHQVRVHLTHIGHPIIGDRVYGGRRGDNSVAERQMLHAWRLGFCHPRTGEWTAFIVPPPTDLRAAAAAVGIEIDAVLKD